MTYISSYIYKLIFITLGTYGCIKLLLGFHSVWWVVLSFFPSQNTIWESFYYNGLILLFNFILPLGAVIASIGGFLKRKWSWVFLNSMLIVIFFKHCLESVIYLMYLLNSSNEIVPSDPNQEGVVYSMLPTYTVALISGVFLAIINNKNIKKINSITNH